MSEPPNTVSRDLDDTPVYEHRTALERHIQTILTGVVAALLAWVGVSLLDLRDRVTRVEVQVLNMQSLIADGTADRFRGVDWLREKARLDDRFFSLQRRVDQLEEEHRGNGIAGRKLK